MSTVNRTQNPTVDREQERAKEVERVKARAAAEAKARAETEAKARPEDDPSQEAASDRVARYLDEAPPVEPAVRTPEQPLETKAPDVDHPPSVFADRRAGSTSPSTRALTADAETATAPSAPATRSTTATAEDPLGPVAIPDKARLDLSTGQTEITVDVLANDRLTSPDDVVGFGAQITAGADFATVSASEDGRITLTAKPGMVPPGGVDVEVTYTVEEASGATSTSTLTVRLDPLTSTGAPLTEYYDNPDPATLKEIEPETLFANQGNAYILYREDENSEWEQIASQVDGVRTQRNFFADRGADLSTGQFIMLTDAGGATDGEHALVGTTASPTGPSFDPTISHGGVGVTNLSFSVGGAEGATDVSVQLTDTAPTIPFTPNSDPADPFVPLRDYTFTSSFEYMHTPPAHGLGITGGGIPRPITTDHSVTFTEEELRNNPMTFSQMQGLARTRLLAEAQATDDKDNRLLSTTPVAEDYSINDSYDGQDVQLVGHGTVVTPPSSGQPHAVAFFIQGDNELGSQEGDTLGRITMEVYPDANTVNRVTDDKQGGNIELTHAVAYNPATGERTNLSDQFFIRPTPGLDGQFEIGLEADQSLDASEYVGQTIALKVRGTDPSGGEYETTIYFNPSTQTAQGQNGTSLELVKSLDQEDVDRVYPAGDDLAALTGSIESQLLRPEAERLHPTIAHYEDRGNSTGHGLVGGSVPQKVIWPTDKIVDHMEITSPPEVSLTTQGHGVSFLGPENGFTPGTEIEITSFDAVSISAEYDIRDQWHKAGSVSGELAVTGATVDNDNFKVVPDGSSFKLVQTGYVDPSSPLEVNLQLTLEGGGTVSVGYTVNDSAVPFPGRDIEEKLINPEIVEGGQTSAALLNNALTGVDGAPNVLLAGTPVTAESIRAMTADLTSVIPDLLADKDLLMAGPPAGLGLSEAQVTELQHSQQLHNAALAAPGYISLGGTDIPTPSELFTQYGKDAELDAVLTERRDAIVKEHFGEDATAESVAIEMMEALSGVQHQDGVLVPQAGLAGDEVPEGALESAYPLLGNLAGLDQAQRSEITRSWMSVATLLDAETTGDFIGAMQSDPSFAYAGMESTLGSAVDGANAQAQLMADKFNIYWEDGTLEPEEIDAILADPELTDEFLLGVRGMMQAGGVDSLDFVETSSEMGALMAGVYGNKLNRRFFATDRNPSQNEALARGLLTALSKTGDIATIFEEPSLNAALNVGVATADVLESTFDVFTYDDLSKHTYDGSRGNAFSLGANTLFALGRLSALAAQSTLPEDVTGKDRFTMGLEIVSAFGSTKGPLEVLASFASRGQAAEKLANGNEYYMTVENDRLVELVSAERGEEISRLSNDILDYRQKQSYLENLRPITQDDGTKAWQVFQPNSDLPEVDARGAPIIFDEAGRKALADEVTNNIVIRQVGEDGVEFDALYSKKPAETGFGKWGEDNFELASGVAYEFDMSGSRAAAILGSEVGDVIEIEALEPGTTDPKTVKLQVTDDLRMQALAFEYRDELGNATVGQPFTLHGEPVLFNGKPVTVTDDLVRTATDFSDNPAKLFDHVGPVTARARITREFLGLDDIQRGLGHFRAAWGARATDSTLEGLEGLSRLSNTLLGANRVGLGVARAASNIADVVGLGFDIYQTVEAFRSDASTVEKAISISNTILSAVGTTAGIGTILGQAAIGAPLYAAAGPVGAVALAATLVLALLTPTLLEAFLPEPTYGEIYGPSMEFLTGDNAFDANLLSGPQVIRGDYDQVEFENGELHIPRDLTGEALGQALGDAHERGEADFLTELYHIFFTYSQPAAEA